MKTFKNVMATGVALMVLLMMGGIAMAYSETFSGFPSPLPYIQQDNKEEMCPMERLSIGKSPGEFYVLIRSLAWRRGEVQT